mgnify:CR=1 FL=1
MCGGGSDARSSRSGLKQQLDCSIEPLGSCGGSCKCAEQSPARWISHCEMQYTCTCPPYGSLSCMLSEPGMHWQETSVQVGRMDGELGLGEWGRV